LEGGIDATQLNGIFAQTSKGSKKNQRGEERRQEECNVDEGEEPDAS
jgi:hypothetical protein